MIQVAVYARISSDPDDTRLGVQRQLADCEELATREGWAVYDRYEDNDISGWSGKRRPEYERLCEDIKAGVVEGLVVWHLDRLHRHPRELEDFITLIDAAGNFAIRTVREGDVDLSSATGRTMARILGAVARQESDNKSARLQRMHAELAAAGKVSGGGNRPYGYTADRLNVIAEEAAIVREAATRALAGESLRSICDDLNQRGVTTSTGGEWTIHTLKRILTGGRISGRREHKGEIVADAEWPAIVTVAESDRLRAALGRGAAGAAPSGRTPRRYLLTGGLLRCGRCDTPMVSRPRSDGTRRYVCASGPGYGGCGRMATVAEPLEHLIVDAVLYRLDTPELAEALADARQQDAEADELTTQIADDQAMLDQLAADYADRTISHREWLAARQPIQTRIDSAKRRLSRISGTHRIDPYVGHSQLLKEAWADLPLSRQQAIVRTVLDHVRVDPATPGRNTFDPDRFIPLWRL